MLRNSLIFIACVTVSQSALSEVASVNIVRTGEIDQRHTVHMDVFRGVTKTITAWESPNMVCSLNVNRYTEEQIGGPGVSGLFECTSLDGSSIWAQTAFDCAINTDRDLSPAYLFFGVVGKEGTNLYVWCESSK